MSGAKLSGVNTLLDFVMQNMNTTITLSEFTEIRNNGDPDEIAEAVSRMEAAGGYDCLED